VHVNRWKYKVLEELIPGMWCSLRRASGSRGKHNIVFCLLSVFSSRWLLA